MESKQLERVILILLMLHIATIKASSLENKSLCTNAPAWTFLPVKQHCAKFYMCMGRKEDSYHEFNCAKDYYFDSHKQRCVRGSCPDLTATTSCDATGISKLQRLKDDCSSYQNCSSRGELSLVKCSEGHYFDAEHRDCLPVAITPAHQCSCILPENAMLANREDCRSYYRCEQGKAVQQQCPQDYYYDAGVNSCLLDTKGVCVTKLLVSELGTTLQECNREGSRLVQHAQDCRRYFVCIGSWAIELTCPKGQFFDVETRYCTFDENSQCFKQTTTQPITTVAPPAQPEKGRPDEVQSDQQAQKVDSSKQTQELHSNQMTNEVAGNKLASKFLLS